MSWRTKDDKWRKPKEIDPPTITEIMKNQEYWKNRSMTYLGDKKYFDQEIRTGVCYFCKKEGKPKRSVPTQLHHLKYDHSDPLAWTIEVCGKCHWQIDENNRKAIARSTGKEIKRRYGKYDSPYYENIEQKTKREEREKKDWYKTYCLNLGGKFIPIKENYPDKETYDKIIEILKKEKTASKKDTMSSVSRSYY